MKRFDFRFLLTLGLSGLIAVGPLAAFAEESGSAGSSGTTGGSSSSSSSGSGSSGGGASGSYSSSYGTSSGSGGSSGSSGATSSPSTDESPGESSGSSSYSSNYSNSYSSSDSGGEQGSGAGSQSGYGGGYNSTGEPSSSNNATWYSGGNGSSWYSGGNDTSWYSGGGDTSWYSNGSDTSWYSSGNRMPNYTSTPGGATNGGSGNGGTARSGTTDGGSGATGTSGFEAPGGLNRSGTPTAGSAHEDGPTLRGLPQGKSQAQSKAGTTNSGPPMPSPGSGAPFNAKPGPNTTFWGSERAYTAPGSVSPYPKTNSSVPGGVMKSKGKAEQGQPIQITPRPGVRGGTIPLQDAAVSSPLSPDNAAANPDYMLFTPYNSYPRELDLSRIEARKFIRSPIAVAPDKQSFAYTEILHMPNNRQTMAKLFIVPVEPLPAHPPERLPSEEVAERLKNEEVAERLKNEEVASPLPETPDPAFYAVRFDPDKTRRTRQEVVAVGHNRSKDYEFRTLTVVDWSASGQKLLFKQRSGVHHVGLRTSDILVFDRAGGTVTIYPEVHRVIRYYWTHKGNLPNIDRVSWDIQPLGWEPGSDTTILLKAWAYDQTEKKFLGLWTYDIAGERTQLLSLEDAAVPVAANGLNAEPLPVTPEQRRAMLGLNKKK